MARNIDKTDPRAGEPPVEIEETERRPGERVVPAGSERAEMERTTTPHDPALEVGTTEARQGVKRPMVGRTLAISLTLAVLAMIILWFVFT